MSSHHSITAEQEREALAWLSVLNNRPTAHDLQRFDAWLNGDPAHAQAYTQAQHLWDLCMGPAAKLASEDTSAMNRLLAAMDTPPRRRRRPWLAAVAMAACLVLMVSLGVGWHPFERIQDLGADYVTPYGQRLNLTLADGTEVSLDANTAIAVNLDGGERRVQLRRGTAFFHVSRNGEPFVVEAGGGETRVLGTQFQVRLQPAGAQVTVLEGRVAVAADDSARQQVLTANQQSGYAHGEIEPLVTVDSQAALAWRDGWLNYYQVPLAQVVADLERYYPGRILLFSEQLAARRVSGSFPDSQPLAVLESLQKVMGFERHTLPGGMIVLR